ncbi:MAG: LptA/OstA family protein [candidate division WOR-3 bacterium]|nr:LptA/OstA family protein [candidate division WOR-3 bacterium]
MILLILMVPYQIQSGTMEIVNRNKNIFKNGVKVYSKNLYIIAENGVETDSSLVLKDSIYVETKDFHFIANNLNYKTPYRILFASGNIKIWRKDTLKGDSLIFYRDSEFGKMFGRILYISDSITIQGESGDFHRDSIVLRGRPKFTSPRITVNSDSAVYFIKDSTYRFLSNVIFESSKISGNSGELKYLENKEKSILLDHPIIIQKRDTITGEKIEVNHKTKILNAFKGRAANYTESGKNVVSGDTVRVYYQEDSIDSVMVLKKSKGRFTENETGSKESR